MSKYPHGKRTREELEQVSQVCFECGISANVLTCLSKYGKRPNQLCFTTSTVHDGKCDFCWEEKSLTEVRDFFYPDFHLLEHYFYNGRQEERSKVVEAVKGLLGKRVEYITADKQLNTEFDIALNAILLFLKDLQVKE